MKIAALPQYPRILSLSRALVPRALRSLPLRDESGSALLETALSLLLTFTLAFWLFELSMFTYTFAVLTEAAHEGVRYAVVHGSDSKTCSGPSSGCTDSTAANVTAATKNIAKMSLHNISSITISPTYPDTSCAPGKRVIVSITYSYIPYFTLLKFNQTVTASAEGRIIF